VTIFRSPGKHSSRSAPSGSVAIHYSDGAGTTCTQLLARPSISPARWAKRRTLIWTRRPVPVHDGRRAVLPGLCERQPASNEWFSLDRRASIAHKAAAETRTSIWVPIPGRRGVRRIGEASCDFASCSWCADPLRPSWPSQCPPRQVVPQRRRLSRSATAS